MVESDWLSDGHDELSPDEYPDEDEYYDEDSVTLVPCPECGSEIDEEAPQCPVCGNYVTHRGSGGIWSGRPFWWILLGVLGIVAMILALGIGI